jgi:hypothetical protein
MRLISMRSIPAGPAKPWLHIAPRPLIVESPLGWTVAAGRALIRQIPLGAARGSFAERAAIPPPRPVVTRGSRPWTAALAPVLARRIVP